MFDREFVMQPLAELTGREMEDRGADDRLGRIGHGDLAEIAAVDAVADQSLELTDQPQQRLIDLLALGRNVVGQRVHLEQAAQ